MDEVRELDNPSLKKKKKKKKHHQEGEHAESEPNNSFRDAQVTSAPKESAHHKSKKAKLAPEPAPPAPEKGKKKKKLGKADDKKGDDVVQNTLSVQALPEQAIPVSKKKKAAIPPSPAPKAIAKESLLAKVETDLIDTSHKKKKKKKNHNSENPQLSIEVKGNKEGKGGNKEAKLAKKKNEKDKLKQITLAESFHGKTPTLNENTAVLPKSSKGDTVNALIASKKKKVDFERTPLSSKSASKAPKPSKTLSTPHPVKSQSKELKTKKSGAGDKLKAKKKKQKMDVVENSNNNQKFNFGQPIDISDNSSDSTELKIATNDDDDTSELSSEYDSSDSEHIMKNIKSFNKKGASKSAIKKEDEPPPPKVKPKIYSSSEDEDDSKEEGDDDDDEEDEVDDEDDDEKEDKPDELIVDGDHPLKPDSEDVFFNGWTKADVKQLLSKIQVAIPRNDNIKASTRVKQLDWEHIKFGAYTAQQCLDKWKTIEKKIRGYRVLQELLTDAQQWLEQPWTDFYKGNKKKYQRHPEMPKKPLTSYMIFYLKKKDKIAKEFPSLPLTDLSKVIAERFNKLAPNKKAKYNEMALEMKEEYMAKMKKFAEAHPAEMTRMYNNGGRTRRTQNTMPGWSGGYKPVAPMKLFLEDKMKQHHGDTEANLPELVTEYKEKWKTLPAKKKVPWIRWAHEAELKYLEELKRYQEENPHYNVPKYKSVLLKEERNLLERMQGKPDKPPPSAYLLFSSVMLKDPNLRKLTPKERMQETARLWKNVPKVEKDGYADKVKHLANVYKLEYASYLESLPEDKRREEMANNVPKRRARSADDGPTRAKKRARTEPKAQAKAAQKPRLTLEEILKKEPQQPPKDAYSLFSQDYSEFPEKEIKKSWEALLDAPRSRLEARVEKLKQQYILDFRKFLKSLAPEDLKIYSAFKSSQNAKIDVKLSESEGSDEDGEATDEEDDEEDEDEEEEEEEDEKESLQERPKSVKEKAVPKEEKRGSEIEVKKKAESSEDSDDEEEEKVPGKSSSSSSSSGSSSDEGSSSTSSSSSSSDDDDDGDHDAEAF